MSSRKSLSATHSKLETEGIHSSGFQAGYTLGFRIGKEDSRRPFDGASIIIPAHLPSQDMKGTLQRIEALTPHPYELLVASSGLSEMTRQYLQQRTGAVRHITAKSGEGIASVLNRAALAAHGQKLVVLLGVSPNIEHWIDDLMFELDKDFSIKTIYVSSDQPGHTATVNSATTSGDEDIHSRMNACCLVFRRKLLSDIGWWNEGLPNLKETVSEWLGRIPDENRIRVEAFDRFT